MSSSDEPERKKRQAASSMVSPPMKKQMVTPMTEEKKVDPSVLQFQNQKLSQQLELQREQIEELECKLQGLHEKQSAYDENLITVNRVWAQLVGDLEVISLKANATLNGEHTLPKRDDQGAEDKATTDACDRFLDRLLKACPRSDPEEGCSLQESLEKALVARSAETLNVLKCVVSGIEQQRRRNDELASKLSGGVSDQEVVKILDENNGSLRRELEIVRTSVDEFHVRQRALSSEVAILRDVRSKQQAEIRHLTDQLEEAQAQLEAAKRKLATLKQQQQQQQAGSSGPSGSNTVALRKSGSLGNALDGVEAEVDKLRADLSEAQALAESRLAELELKHKQQVELTEKLRQQEALLGDELHVKACRPYRLLAEQLEVSRAEADRYRGIVEQLQKEKDAAAVREKDMVLRAEAGDAARRSCALSEAAVEELEEKLQQVHQERDALQLKMEELQAVAGRTDTVAELKVMISTMHDEMNMLKQQLREQREKEEEMHAVQAENTVLETVLQRKTEECNELRQRCGTFNEQRRQWETEMRAMRGVEMELRMFVDMYSRQSQDHRDVAEIRAAEARALARAEALRVELEEHHLVLRVKAANEAEAACQERLAAAETQIARLHHQLDEKDRRAAELQSMLKARTEEGDVFMGEIETISQAYEDMQSQNRRLVQQIKERDTYNTQLMAESVKAKQLQVSLKAEKEVMAARMQHSAAAAQIHRQRVAQLEEQVKKGLEQLAKAMEEARQHRLEGEAIKRQQQEAEREAARARAAVEEAREDLKACDKRVTEAEVELEKERFKRKRVEEEKEALAQKLAKLGAESQRGAASQQQQQHMQQQVELLREELKEYKSILKCSVCHDRQKEVVITKCFHLFCAPCIQRNLELRHRKCPGCGVPFGQGDVRTVYI